MRRLGPILFVAALALCSLIGLHRVAVVHAQAPGSGCPSSTAFGSQACSLAVGTFAHIANSAMTAWNTGNILQPSDGGSVTEYADKASWNPITSSINYLGGSHPSVDTQCGATLFVSYKDSTNTWSDLTSPCPNYAMSFSPTNWGHSYEDVTIDPATGNYFIRQYGGAQVAMFSQSSQTWSLITSLNCGPCEGGEEVNFGGLEWFPDRNSLVAIDGLLGIEECVFSGSNSNGTPCSSWTQIACLAFSCSPLPQYTQLYNEGYDNRALYSPLCHCVLFTGEHGQTSYIRYYANGTFSSVSTSAPFGIDTNVNVFVVDPASGRYIVANGNSNACEMWSYDPSSTGSNANTWTDLGYKEPQCPTAEDSSGGTANIIAVPIPIYNVIAFIYQGSAGSNGSVYLYKYTTPGTGDYIQRSEQSGVFMANPLATSGNITGAYGANFGNCCAGSTNMAIDTSIYPGNGGSMLCAIPANATGDDPCSDFFQNFGATNGALTFSDGQTFYIQYMMWMDASYLADEPTGGEGQKQSIIGQGDPSTCTTSSSTTCVGSCTDPEQVTLNNSYRGNPSGFPQHYTSCNVFNPITTAVSTTWNSDNFLDQTDRNNCYQYLNPTSGQTGSTFFPPYGNCVAYPTGQWFSIEEELTIGTYSTSCPSSGGITNCNLNSVLNVWIAPLGQAYAQTMDSTFNLYNNSHATFGKIWLLTYNTAATHWAGNYNVRWAELIGSTNFIAAPAVVADSSIGSGVVSLSPSSYNFGSIGVGASSAPVTFTLTNNNATTATSVDPVTSEGNSGDFIVTNSGSGSCSAAGGSIAMGTSCTFTVKFSPSAASPRSTTLSVSYSGGDGDSPQTAALSGVGIAPATTRQGLFARGIDGDGMMTRGGLSVR